MYFKNKAQLIRRIIKLRKTFGFRDCDYQKLLNELYERGVEDGKRIQHEKDVLTFGKPARDAKLVASEVGSLVYGILNKKLGE